MKRPEDALQESVVDLLTRYHSMGQLRFYTVPNEGKRKPKTAAQLKRRGMSPGVPDLVLLFPGGRSAYWELKAGKNKPSENQAEWLNWLGTHGFETAIIRDANDAANLLQTYLKRAA